MDEPNPGDTPIAWAIKNNSGGKRRMREAPVIPFFADQEPSRNWGDALLALTVAHRLVHPRRVGNGELVAGGAACGQRSL